MRRVVIKVTETYVLDIEAGEDGTDAVLKLDALDEDDHDGAAYQGRECKVYDDETGEELLVNEGEI